MGIRSSLAADGGAPSVQVELLAENSAVVPGSRVALAVQFRIQEGWHIYWRNPGEGGLEPTFSWKLPPEFTVGPMVFPVPSRHVDAADAHTFILEGEPVLLTQLAVPSDVKAGESVTVAVDVKWLVCKEACFMGEKSLSLMLPVVANAAESRVVNEEVFRIARASLPVPAYEARYLKGITGKANVNKVVPGGAFEIAVTLEIEPDHHINAHRPGVDFLIPTDLFPDRVDGVWIGRARFERGETEPAPLGEGQIFVYRGRTTIVLPVEADEALSGDSLRFGGVVTYQACSDKTKQCFAPMSASWELTLPIAQPGETVVVSKPAGFTLETDIAPTVQQEEHSLLVWLVLAFLAGAVLNVTPCVLPVISIKVLSFVQQASESPAKVLKLGLAFSLGMLAVFNLLAVLATVMGLVWGQHFQSSGFTIVMAAVVFAFGLSLFGVFTLGVPRAVGDVAAKAETGEGYAGSVAKGALATVMGTPCLGPFLGSVLVWVAGQTPLMVFLVFNTIGVGMAMPYILLTAHPKWLRFVPKPGPWLTTFKQGMAFLLMGTVVYLLYILQGQVGGLAVVGATAFLTAVGLACWIIGCWLTVNSSAGQRVGILAVGLLVALLGGWFGLRISEGGDGKPGTSTAMPDGGVRADDTTLPWVDFSMERLTELTESGRTVFLDITARWCPNCKVNLSLVFNSREVADAVERYGVVPMLADWTSRDETIGRLIDKLAPGASIPLCAVFPAGRPDEPVVMLGLVTKQQVIDELKKAAEGVQATGS